MVVHSLVDASIAKDTYCTAYTQNNKSSSGQNQSEGVRFLLIRHSK